MRVLVTGAAGFIGSHVAKALRERGHEVHAIVRSSSGFGRLNAIRRDLTIWQTDLHDQEGVRLAVHGAAPDAAVHLAWYTDPGRYLHDRLQNLASLAASAALIGHLLEAGCPRLLLGGTCLEAGDAFDRRPTFYATAKRSLHDLATGLGDERLSVACGHIFSVYGPAEGEGRAVPSITNALLGNRAVDVTPATQMRD